MSYSENNADLQKGTILILNFLGEWGETLLEGRPMKRCFASIFKPNFASEPIFCCLLRSISLGVSQSTGNN